MKFQLIEPKFMKNSFLIKFLLSTGKKNAKNNYFFFIVKFKFNFPHKLLFYFYKNRSLLD